MFNIQFIAAIILLLVTQWSDARSLNGASGTANRKLILKENLSSLLDPLKNPGFLADLAIWCANDFANNDQAPIKEIHPWLALLNNEEKREICKPYRPSSYKNHIKPQDEHPALRVWPKLESIGYTTMKCNGRENVPLIECADLVLNGLVEPNFKHMLDQINQNVPNFLHTQYRQSLPRLSNLGILPVYNDTTSGKSIGIVNAYVKSLHVFTGEVYRRDLKLISASLASISKEEIAQKLSNFPALVDFESKALTIEVEEKTLGMNRVNEAIIFLCVESLNTTSLETRLKDINDEMLTVKHHVDYFLQMKYPNLVEFKYMGSFKDPKLTIEYLASLEMHSAFLTESNSYLSSSMNEGAGSIKDSVDRYMEKKYGHCNVLDKNMENISGRNITFRTAIKFTLNPQLLSSDKCGKVQEQRPFSR